MQSSIDVQSRPAYRPYEATVAGVERIAPHFVRVRFTSPDFSVFGTAGLDQRINAGIPAYEEALKAAKVNYTVYMYPDSNHAFNNDTSAERNSVSNCP